MAKVRKSRVDATGRNPERVGSADRTIILRRSFWHSPHIAALSSSGRALVLELQSMFNGSNNGELFLSVRDAADRLGFTDLAAAQHAIDELLKVGLLATTIGGSFNMTVGGTSKARAFRLNWIGADGKCVSTDKLSAVDFSKLSSRQKKRIARRADVLERYLREQQERKSSVRETRTLMDDSVRETRTEAADSIRETRTPNEENGENPPSHSVRESLTHILHHIPTEFSGSDPARLDPLVVDGPLAAEKAA